MATAAIALQPDRDDLNGEIESVALRVHERLKEARRIYGNVHFVYRFNLERFDGFKQTKSVSFWSSGDECFRIDEEVVSGDSPPVKSRFILNPSGFSSYSEKEGRYSLFHSGDRQEGSEYLNLQEFYQASARCFRYFDAEVPFGKVKGLPYTNQLSRDNASLYTPLKVSEENDGLTLISTNQSRFDGKLMQKEFVTEFDLNLGVHLSHKQSEKSIGGVLGNFQCIKEYDFGLFKTIPKSIVIQEFLPGGQWTNTSWQLEVVEFGAADEVIFEMEKETSSVNPLWLVLGASIGLGLGGGTLLYGLRRQKS